MSAIDRLTTALFGNPATPNFKPDRIGVLEAITELYSQIQSISSGVPKYMSVSDLPADAAVGSQGRVYLDPTAANNTFWIKKVEGWGIDTDLIRSIAAIVQPLIDAAGVSAQSAANSAALAQSLIASTLKFSRSLNTSNRTGGLTIEYLDGGQLVIVDSAGRTMTMLPSGISEPTISDNTRWGERALSPGPIDGEIIVRSYHDADGYIRMCVGINGGLFLETPEGLKRANANTFQQGSPVLNFTGEAYVTGMQERMHYQSGATKTAIILIGAGQSNEDGQNNDTNDPLVSGVAVYPNYALMLQGGPRQTTTTGSEVLVPLIETVVGSNGNFQQETPISGWANHIIRDHYSKFAFYPTVVGLSVAQGDRPYSGNKRGSDVYKRIETALPKIVNALKAQGFTAFQTVVGYIGSEGDFGQTARMTPTRFAGQMRQFHRQLGETIRRITGEVTDPLLIVMQPGNTTADAFTSPVREGMRRLHGQEGIICAGPTYQFAMANGDVIHRNNVGKYGSGVMLARATMAEMFGMTWHGVRPQGNEAYWLNETQFAIDMDIMGSTLTLDTTGAIVSTAGLANSGFVFADGSGSSPVITNVQAVDMTVTITLSAPSIGPRPRVSYAGQRNAGNTTTDGPVVGARGVLRDNSVYNSIANNAPQYCWSDAFIVNLPPRF